MDNKSINEYVVDKETHDKLRREYMTYDFQNRLNKEKLRICVNCGSQNSVQYHHIVPLVYGGTNNFGNIVPLCYNCHSKVHGTYKTNKARVINNNGRPKVKPIDGYEDVLEKYFSNQIGTKECKKLLGLTEKSRLTEIWYIKEYREQHNIADCFKNNIDMMSYRDRCKNGEVIKKQRKQKLSVVIKDGNRYFVT